MRIIVPIKQVPETTAVRMDEATGTMIREGVDSIVNPLDLYAIELALMLREAHGGEVVAISMGPPSAVRALREAIAMGCDSAVLASHKAFAGSDTWATANVLAAMVRKLGGFDMVICGERATDGDTGQVGPEMAAFLDLPIVTYVGKVAEVQEKRMVVHRLVEDGHEILEFDMPAVISVVKEVSYPRLPTLRGKRSARASVIPIWGPSDIAVDEETVGLRGSPTRVVKVFKPKVSRQCEKLAASDEASINTAVDRLVDILKTKSLI